MDFKQSDIMCVEPKNAELFFLMSNGTVVIGLLDHDNFIEEDNCIAVKSPLLFRSGGLPLHFLCMDIKMSAIVGWGFTEDPTEKPVDTAEAKNDGR